MLRETKIATEFNALLFHPSVCPLLPLPSLPTILTSLQRTCSSENTYLLREAFTHIIHMQSLCVQRKTALVRLRYDYDDDDKPWRMLLLCCWQNNPNKNPFFPAENFLFSSISFLISKTAHHDRIFFLPPPFKQLVPYELSSFYLSCANFPFVPLLLLLR